MKKATAAVKTKKGGSQEGRGDSPSRLIDARIKELGDWRGAMLGRLRALVKAADPDVIEKAKQAVRN